MPPYLVPSADVLPGVLHLRRLQGRREEGRHLSIQARGCAEPAGWRLEGCTLVVTLEPCTMCAGAAVLARVSTVVYGAVDPKAGAAGSLWDVLRDRRLNSRPEVVGGVLEHECGELLRAFFEGRRGLR